jgi:NAD(P)-dependent dehydrogenase (short-subunit alcohol dehydrogenase family)
VLITGGTAGLGYYCALNIARQHPDYQIVIASGTDLNGSAASINQLLDQSNVSYMQLDLSKLAQIRQFVNEWEARQYPPIQALLLNAGLQFPAGIQYTEDGFESTFAVNHIVHSLLFFLMRPHFTDTAGLW